MFPRENNPSWPLPQDYPVLSRDGQRMARLTVCRDTSSWPAFRTAFLFFIETYLIPQGPTFWGESGFLKPAPGHILMLRDYYHFPLCVEAYTRGGGKTTLFAIILPMMEAMCHPNRRIVVCSASDKLLDDKAGQVMNQLRENSRIVDDFGMLVPKKGTTKVFNKHYMGLLNGSVLREMTIESRQLGVRAGRYFLDDPEYDKDAKTQERFSDLRERLQRFIERDVIYMLDPGFMKFFWTGTMRGARSYLHHVCFSRDKKFNNWTRRIQSGAVLDKDGNVTESTWKERFPVEHLKFVQGLNREAFMTEIMNCPAEEKARLLIIDPISNEYTVSKPPANLDQRNAPHLPDPDATMTYHWFYGYNPDGSKRWQNDTVNQKDYFDKCLKIATFDYAENNTSTSDMKALAITGIDAKNTWWRMDLWAGWMRDVNFWDFMIKFCAAWRVDIIAPETVAKQKFLIETISRRLFEGEADGLIPLDWHPQVVPVQYPAGLSQVKGIRIQTALEYRMQRGAVKFPRDYGHKWPFNEERSQIQFFTVDLSELKRDDIIDAVSMLHFVPHGRGLAEPTHGVNPIQNVTDALKQGKPFIQGEEALVGMPLENIRQEYVATLLRQQEAREQAERQNVASTWDRPVVVG
jgi:hypothetical protein